MYNQSFVHYVHLNFLEEVQLYSVYKAQLDWKAFPPELYQCPNGARGGQFTPSPSAGWTGPIGRMRPPFTTGDNPPIAFPGCAAVGGPPWPGPVHSAQHAKEDWQSMLGTAVFMQLIGLGRHTWPPVGNGATIRQDNEFHFPHVVCLSLISRMRSKISRVKPTGIINITIMQAVKMTIQIITGQSEGKYLHPVVAGK